MKDISKKYIIGGRNLIESSAAYVNIKNCSGNLLVHRDVCDPTRSVFLVELKSKKALSEACDAYLTKKKDEWKREEVVKKTFETTKKKINNTKVLVDECIQREDEKRVEIRNIRRAIFWACLDYFTITKEIKEEREYQNWLNRARDLIFNVGQEMQIYEEKVSELAVTNKNYLEEIKNRHDLLQRRKHWCNEMADKFSEAPHTQFTDVMEKCETTFLSASNLWPKWFKTREIREDTLDKLVNLDASLARLKKKACEQNAVNVAFNWFVDWVIHTLIGLENVKTVVPNLTNDSNLREKGLALIEYHRIIRMKLEAATTKRYEATRDVFNRSIGWNDKPLTEFVY